MGLHPWASLIKSCDNLHSSSHSHWQALAHVAWHHFFGHLRDCQKSFGYCVSLPSSLLMPEGWSGAGGSHPCRAHKGKGLLPPLNFILSGEKPISPGTRFPFLGQAFCIAWMCILYLYIHLCVLCIYIYIHTCVCIIYTYTYTYVYLYIYIYIYLSCSTCTQIGSTELMKLMTKLWV